ncbi:poly-gamma-glutamate hydrolase family protein [Rhizobium leguminosarum]|uniref:poly-gamma-glutamate hydrolase family protein n=1 Tax=Rhizobium leguminosarum TaxID=384 RepID=UPI0016109A1C
MVDRYSSYAELSFNEAEGVTYRIRAIPRGSNVVIAAPHGGEIEPGTSQIAEAIAGNCLSLYCFEGLIRGRNHRDLHITSTKFDEPRGCDLVQTAELVVGIHGRRDHDSPDAIWLGGRDDELKAKISNALTSLELQVASSGHHLLGMSPDNICNRGRRRAGIQFEFPASVRDSLMRNSVALSQFGSLMRKTINGHLRGL